MFKSFVQWVRVHIPKCMHCGQWGDTSICLYFSLDWHRAVLCTDCLGDYISED